MGQGGAGLATGAAMAGDDQGGPGNGGFGPDENQSSSGGGV